MSHTGLLDTFSTAGYKSNKYNERNKKIQANVNQYSVSSNSLVCSGPAEDKLLILLASSEVVKLSAQSENK